MFRTVSLSLRTVVHTAGAGLLAITLASTTVFGQWSADPWPAEAGFSDKYRVFVRCGQETEKEIPVLLSHASWQGDYRGEELKGRTFSWAPLTYDPAGGVLTIRVEKTFGSEGPVRFAPSRTLLEQWTVRKQSVAFQVRRTGLYFSVHFDTADNATPQWRWIRHMLCLFIDAPETGAPAANAPGVVTFHPGLSAEALSAARVIRFAPGFHALAKSPIPPVLNEGVLTLASNQSLYLAGGAFVEGLVWSDPVRSKDQRVFGRGVLSGRTFLWRNHPDFKGKEWREILRLGDRGVLEGITLMDSPNHGIVAGTRTSFRNIKLSGWHCNNDGIRANMGSTIRDSFLRAVDDHFYNFKNHVSNVVLWAGHNGAILTIGWGGDKTYGSGASLLEDIDIIHPEWTTLGNNNGLVASQVNYDYRPTGYGGDPMTVLRRIRIEGSMPGLVNLKPQTGPGGRILSPPVPPDQVGSIHGIRLEDITVIGTLGMGRLFGSPEAATSGRVPFMVSNIELKNLRLGDSVLTAEAAHRFFAIDPGSTADIRIKP